MNSIKGGHFVQISGVYKQHPAPRLETECQTCASSSTPPPLSNHVQGGGGGVLINMKIKCR